MSITITPHLNFRGNARAALEFYQSVFGGDLTIFTYQDAHQVPEPSEADWVMWGQVAAANGFRVMAFDVSSRRAWDPGEIPFFLSARGDTAEEATRYWEKLSEGALAIPQPLGPAFWTPLYGMVKDRFGVTWIVDVASENQAA